MNKDKIKRKDLRFFILPLIALLILFAIGTTIIANINVNEYYKIIEKSTLDIAKSYASGLINAADASEKINKLLEEKLVATIHAVISTENITDDEVLKEVAEKFKLDEIYLYNEEGVITHSYTKKYLDWKAPEDHPVYQFMISDEDYLVEDIRKDSESDLLYKYAYKKGKDNTLLQVGIIAESVYNLLQRFTIDDMLQDIMNISDVQNVIFTDENHVSTLAVPNNKSKQLVIDKHFHNHDDIKYARAETIDIEGSSILHVCVPVILNGEKIGILTIVWGDDYIDERIQKIFVRSIIAFCIVALAVSIILYYAFKADRQNFEIAFFDKLTGLPNLEYLNQYLDRRLRNLEETKTSVLLLNCVNFRIVNLTYGFKFGDQTIARIANNIKCLENQNITLFRLGQDRFAFVVENYKDTDELILLAKKIIKTFNSLGEGELKYEFIVPEVGIYEIKDNNLSVDKILKYASLALSNISSDLNKNIAVYSCEMEELVQREAQIEKALRAIIQREDKTSFYLVFQPKIDLRTNKIVGFEALARMKNDELGFVSPVEFIAIAEKRMLIYDLGNLIIEKACDFLSELIELGYEDISVAVNISGIQLLRDDFYGAVKKIITSKGVPFDLLEFEITESVFMDNFDIINEKIRNIKTLGIATSLDDFGTGYSSFARLSELSIDIIKIDKHITDKISFNNEENLIVADIISMAHKIGLHVVAEGVENEEQMNYLAENSCDVVQGFYLSKPLDIDDAFIYLKTVNES